MGTKSWSRAWIGMCLVGAGLLAAAGCSVDTGSEEATAVEVEQSVVIGGRRCTVTGDPAVTQGCGENETCRLVACTESIPPSCFGTCAPSACEYGVGRDCCGNLACRQGPKLPPPCPIFCPVTE